MNSVSGLWMMRLCVPDPLRYQRFLQSQRLPPHPHDGGYGAHCLLVGLFGKNAPKPYALSTSGRRGMEILAYTETSPENLQDCARTYASPEVWALVDWESFDRKPMPHIWPEGTCLGFDVRSCPVSRGTRCGPERADSGGGNEVDVYLASVWRNSGDTPGREEIYRDWLRSQVEKCNAAAIRNAKMTVFRLSPLARRDGERRIRTITRPDVSFRGILEVRNGEAFTSLLKRGVGRHRAFGYGMILLRRPE